MKGDGIRYKPNHLFEIFAAHRGALAVTLHLHDEMLIRPLYAGRANRDVVAVVDELRRAIGSATS